MNAINWKNTLALSGPVLCGLAFKLMRSRITKQCDTTINEVLFYGAQGERQTKEELGLDNLFCIYYVIAHASRSVDVCVPSLESETMAKCLITVQQRNQAKIRVAIHNSDKFCNLTSFAKHGIEVKVIRSAERLEHEFVLVDAAAGAGDALALLGSLDYETDRVNCNRDSTMLTSEPVVVTNLQREFDRIWQSTPDLARVKDDKVDKAT